MTKATSSTGPKATEPKAPRGKRGAKPAAHTNKATTEEFEREDMGIAAKE